jgi:glycosyltransferase involved in cell wall biosynthesis
LKTWDPEVLIVEANPRYLRTPAALRWMHRTRPPGNRLGAGRAPALRPAGQLRHQRRTRFINQFDALITYSQTGAGEYAHLGFPQERIFVAVNAVVTPHRLPCHPGAPPADSVGRVLFVGRLQARKQVDNLLASLCPIARCAAARSGDRGRWPRPSGYKTLATKFIPKQHSPAPYGAALAEQFRSADLFVLPGTGGLAIQQAMSFGLPVIAAEADGTQADLVRPGNGWQIPPNDVSALQSALATSTGRYPRIAQDGRRKLPDRV